MDVKNRLEFVKSVNDAIRRMKLTDGSPSCISQNNVIVNTFKLVSKIGSGSRNGEAFKICYPIKCNQKSNDCACQKDSIYLAVKRIPITPSTVKYKDEPYSANALKDSLWIELLSMKLCNILVENNVTPNLPMYVNYFYCSSCQYENIELTKKNGYPCIIVINELATEGDLANWSKKPRSSAEWINAFFQIFVGLYALQKYFDITHHDLHWGNVLVHNVKPGGYWRYIIDKQTYDVPNLGYLFVLWDFGLARIPGKMQDTDYDFHYNSTAEKPRLLADYSKIIKAPLWRANDTRIPIPIPADLSTFLEWIRELQKEGATLKEVIKMYRKLYIVQRSENILAEFSLDKKIKLSEKFKEFVNLNEIPSKTRPPSEEEIILQDKLANVMKNGFVAQTKKKRRGFAAALKQLSQTKSFTERIILTAELDAINYPPAPVVDISHPEADVQLNEQELRYLRKIDRGYNGKWPDFVDDIMDTILSDNKLVNRALWARFIEWMIQVKIDNNIIELLKHPINDYYQDQDQPMSILPLKSLQQQASQSSLQIDTSFIALIMDEMESMGDQYNSGNLTDPQALAMVVGMIKRIYAYINKLDETAGLDVTQLIMSSRYDLAKYACVLRALQTQNMEIDNETINLLKDDTMGRLAKLTHILHVFVTLLMEKSSTQILLDTLKSVEFGALHSACGFE
jgi:hypothetical protein